MLSLRFRRGLLWLALAVALFGAAATYLCLPALRLAIRPNHLNDLSEIRHVPASRFDPEWFDAARAGRVDIIAALHQAGYPLNRQTGAGYTALVLAAYDGQPAALNYLLRAGADACRADQHGNTALMGAIYKGENAIARRLLASGCPIDQSNHAGETALAFATLFGRLDLLPPLIARGADINHPDAQGKTPLRIALEQGNSAVAASLRRLGAHP